MMMRVPYLGQGDSAGDCFLRLVSHPIFRNKKTRGTHWCCARTTQACVYGVEQPQRFSRLENDVDILHSPVEDASHGEKARHPTTETTVIRGSAMPNFNWCTSLRSSGVAENFETRSRRTQQLAQLLTRTHTCGAAAAVGRWSYEEEEVCTRENAWVRRETQAAQENARLECSLELFSRRKMYVDERNCVVLSNGRHR